MKKIITIFCLLIFFVFGVFAWQKTYNSQSEEYQLLVNLCELSEVSAPIMVSPISSEQFLIILEKIDIDKLDDVSKELYVILKEKVDTPPSHLNYKDNLKINGFSDISFEFARQSEKESDFMVAKKDRKPLVNIGAEIFFYKNIYAFFSFDLINTGLNYDPETGIFHNYSTNIPTDYNEMDFSSPHKAFVSLGGKNANLIIGRDKLNLGNGITGNLGLGDTLWYQDFLKASVLNGPISYDMTVMSFQNSIRENVEDHIKNPFDLSDNPLFSEMHQLVFLHNLSFEPVKQLSFSLYEGALIYGNSISADLRNINPMFVLHNTYTYMIGGTKGGTNAGNMNNFFGFEAKYAFQHGWAADIQVMFDQIQFNDEKSADESQNAFGVLANVSHTVGLFGGIANFYFEGVYTSPNLYLKEDQVACKEYWNLDLIVGQKLVWTPSNNDFSYLGYKYGPDSIVLATGCTWNNFSNLKLGFSGIFKLHGTQGALFYEEQHDAAIEMGEDLKFDFLTLPLEKRLVLNLNVEYTLSQIFSFEGGLEYQVAWNYHNTNNTYRDVQFAVSATVCPMKLIKTR